MILMFIGNSKELTVLLGMIWQVNDADYRGFYYSPIFHGEYRNQGNAYRLSPIFKTAQVNIFHICPSSFHHVRLSPKFSYQIIQNSYPHPPWSPHHVRCFHGFPGAPHMAPGDPTSRPRRCAASEDAKNAMAPHFSAKAFLDSERLMATTWESWESWTGPVVDLRTNELLIE